MLDDAHEGLLALDEHGTIVEANESAARIVGHDRRALAGKPLAALIVLPDRRGFRRALGALEPGGPAGELQLRFHSDPEPLTATLRLMPRATPRRILIRLARAGDPLPPQPRTDEHRIEHLLLRFPYAVVAVRSDLRVAFTNAQARTLLGRKVVRTGLPFAPESPELGALARRLVATPAPLVPTNVELPDGRIVRVRGVAAGSDLPAALILEDVTAAVRQDQVMREFVRNAAHQLRTPLAGITAAVETLQAGAKEDPDTRDRFLDHIESHAARLTRIARGLLVLARGKMGEQVRVDLVEVQPLFDEIAATTTPRDGVGVRTACPPGLAVVAAPDLLHEVLSALVENAVAHTLDGEIRLAATAVDGRITLAVTDSGPGILPEFRDRVFEPFFRVGDDGRGYGLGLAIAAQAVAAMGGAIEVSGEPGKGTTFTVTLRAASDVR
jgi:signal transduction histidine kinase